jgi:glycosyltransferase involved in cell wall biosynthesis
MKIALVTENTIPRPGAALADDQIRTRELARTLAAAGHQVTVYIRKHRSGTQDMPRQRDAVRVVELGPHADNASDLLGGVPAFTAPLHDSWRKDRPDVIHAMRWTSGLSALAASRDLRIPVVQTFATLGVAERRHRVLPGTVTTERIRLEPAIGRSADAVVAGNSGDATDLARLGVPRRSIKVIPCGVDTSRFVPEGPVADRNGHPRLMTVTDLFQTRALDTLLRALARVPDAELVVVGGPPPDTLRGDTSYQELNALATSLDVSDRVQFTGHVDEDELPPLLRSADLYVSTTEYEPTGMTSLDAMACGTPVVASAAGAPADAVVDGTTGIMVPPGRPALLAHRIRQLLSHPMMLEAYGVAAADRARSRYSWDRIAKETLAVYETAAAA